MKQAHRLHPALSTWQSGAMQPSNANRTSYSTCIVGQGSIGLRHRAVLSQMGHDVAVVSRRHDSNESLTYPSLSAALAVRNFDYVVIATETAQHRQDLETLENHAFQGRVLVEKPLFAESTPIIKRHWPDVYVAYQLRFHPILRRLRDLVGTHPILSASFYVGQHLDTWRPGRLGRDTYSGSRAAGGGALRDLSHELDLADWLLGPCQEVVSIGGRLGTVTHDSDDSWSVLARHEQCPAVAISLNYLNHIPQRHLTLITADVTCQADLVAGTLTVNGVTTPIASDRNMPIMAMHESVMAGQKDACDLTSGLRTVAVIDAIERAAAERKWISL